jgi:hypothetical protein
MLDVTKLQPINTFYEVEMGGMSEIYRYPQHPVSMKVDLDVTKTGKVEFSLFDDTGFIVESYLWASGGKARIRWGYFHNGGMIASPFYNVILLNYKVVVGKNYFTLNVNGMLSGEAAFESKAYSGTLHEVIDKFAKDYGYKVEFTPPISKKYLRGLDPSGKTTLIKDWEFRKPANKTDGAWIAEIIRQYARSESGVGGYDVIFTENKDGEKVMRMVLADQVDNRWRWTVQEKNSNVLDWQPEIDVNLSAGFGNKEIVSQGIAEVTGNLTKIVANRENIRRFTPRVAGGDETFDSPTPIMSGAQNVYENSESVPRDIANRGVRVRPNTTINKYLDLNPIFSGVAIEQIQQTIKGTLVILGDPEVTNGYRCDIKFLYPAALRFFVDGYRPPEHYSSGTYYINQVVHDIKVGSYLTTLQVSRDAVSAAPERGNYDE